MVLRKRKKTRMVLRKRKKTRRDMPKRKKRTLEESIREEYEEEVKFMKVLAETDGFDVEHLMDKRPTFFNMDLRNDGNYPTRVLVYAKMGIHKYNFLKGKNLQLSHIEKYNVRYTLISCDYYITLFAKDPDAPGSLVPFQTNVVIEGFDHENLLVGTARRKDDPVEPSTPESVDDDDSYPRDAKLPKWPSDYGDAFQDQSRYYLVAKSELQEYDWIRTYTELAFVRENIRKDKVKEPELLSRLAIEKVAVESPKTVERPKDRLKATNATFYIKYKYRHPKARVGQVHVAEPEPEPYLYGIAVVRRTMDEGCFTVMLDTCFV